MKIAVSSFGTNLDAWVGSSFARCRQFVLVDSETMQYIVISVSPAQTVLEATLEAIRTLATHGAQVAIVGQARRECVDFLATMGIKVIAGVHSLTIREAVERYRCGELDHPEGRAGGPLRIAVSASEESLDAIVTSNSRDKVCFLIVEPESLTFTATYLSGLDANGEIDPLTLQTLVQHRVSEVVVPRISRGACPALCALGIQLHFPLPHHTVRQAIEWCKRARATVID